MSDTMRRRSVLHSTLIGVFGLISGCSSLVESRNSPEANDLTVRNDRTSTVSFDMVVKRSDGETVHSTRHEIPPQSTRIYEDVVEYGQYELTIAVAGSSSSSQDWSASGCQHMTVEIMAEGVDFIESAC